MLCGWSYLVKPDFFRVNQPQQKLRIQVKERLERKSPPVFSGLWLHRDALEVLHTPFSQTKYGKEKRFFKLTWHFWGKAAKTKPNQTKTKQKTEVPASAWCMTNPLGPPGDHVFHSLSRVRMQMTHSQEFATLWLQCVKEIFQVAAPPLG